MSTSYYSSSSYYDQEQKRKAEERKTAPKTCPHCGVAINEGLWDRVRYHCGADKCRKAASRHNIAERKRQERSAARAYVLQYCEQQLDRDQKNAVMEMTDLLMAFDYSGGHQIAQQVIKVIESKRCKHDKIAQLEANAALWQRKEAATERQLKERIAELEEELSLFNSLNNTIHGIATQQLQKQPDPQERQPSAQEPEPDNDDRARVLATLAHIGIKPIEQALAEQDDEDSESYEGEEDDDPESYEDDEEPEE